MRNNSEAWTQHEILKAWGAHPSLRLWRQNTGAAMVKGRLVRFGSPGCPDILGALAPTGRLIGIEVKAPDGRQSAEQKSFQAMFERMGALYVLARDVETVDRALAELGITR